MPCRYLSCTIFSSFDHLFYVTISSFLCRYVNMDYLFFSSLSMLVWLWLVMSYDIVCQWHVNLWRRMSAFPRQFHFDRSTKQVTFLVPKFHLPAHVQSCQTAFSFNLTRGVGRTDGEAPERGWSDMNPISSQTKHMGPVSRRDTIDDHLGDWNHKKVTGFGMYAVNLADLVLISCLIQVWVSFASSRWLSPSGLNMCWISWSFQTLYPQHHYFLGRQWLSNGRKTTT